MTDTMVMAITNVKYFPAIIENCFSNNQITVTIKENRHQDVETKQCEIHTKITKLKKCIRSTNYVTVPIHSRTQRNSLVQPTY